ncbi:MAG TPA: oligopeptide/dipeptide ABC transporter ATP-binding protein [Ramlibacter sp.]|nr:oligopeptide/dipeptide ABC transporter ATP-binding protein [Ramlibacter sp.]
MTAPVPLLEVRDLQVRFGALRAVDGVSFRVERGETFGVIGESGSGKSTLGRALVSLLRPTHGQVLHDGADPAALPSAAFRRHRRDWQIVFQDPHAALNPRMTILDSVREPLDIAGTDARDARNRRALEMLDRVGLSAAFADRYPHELSGGQKQRVNIARALTVRPRLLVCDEVVAALDVSIQADILNLLAQLQADFGLTYVFITHDLGVVSHVSDRIAVMYLGVFMELAPAEELRRRPRHPYTEALLSAEPEPLPAPLRRGGRILLEGEIPSPLAPPSGCRFRTRCRYAQELCAQQVPEYRELAPGHWAACHFADQLTLAGRDEPAAAAVAETAGA